MFSRRNMLGFGAAGALTASVAAILAAVFGDPDEPPQGAITVPSGGRSDPGPRSLIWHHDSPTQPTRPQQMLKVPLGRRAIWGQRVGDG